MNNNNYALINLATLLAVIKVLSLHNHSGPTSHKREPPILSWSNLSQERATYLINHGPTSHKRATYLIMFQPLTRESHRSYHGPTSHKREPPILSWSNLSQERATDLINHGPTSHKREPPILSILLHMYKDGYWRITNEQYNTIDVFSIFICIRRWHIIENKCQETHY